jgi:hypothetical protein
MTIDGVAELIAELPEVTEGERHGNRTWYVNGRAFAWERPVTSIPHFDGYAAVLVQLKKVTRKALREVIVDGWAACAPPALVERHLAGDRPGSGRRRT